MFVFLCFILSLPGQSAKSVINDVDLFLRLRGSEAVFYDNHFYIFNASEYKLEIYDRQGSLIQEVGGKGNGPGSFKSRGRLQVVKNQIVVIERYQVSWFSLKGSFVKSFKRNSLGFLTPSAKGWLHVKREIGTMPHQLYLMDDDLKNERLLIELDYEDRKSPATHEGQLINPAPERVMIRFSKDRDYAFLRAQDASEVLIFSIEKEAVTAVAKVEPLKIPFDTKKGDEYLASYQAELRKDFPGWVATPDYPKYYPEITGIGLDDEGNLMVFRPGKEEDRDFDLFDMNGNPLPKNKNGKPHISECRGRIVGREGGVVFVTTYDEEEAAIWEVPSEQAEQFCIDHVIPDDIH